MYDVVFCTAENRDLEDRIKLIYKRIEWMDERGLHQWNETNYLNIYNICYFESLIENGEMYVLKQEDEVVAAVALFESDARWKYDKHRESFYVHHLVTSTKHPGVGTILLERCEQMAIRLSKCSMRLDCQTDNDRLNALYESLGYVFVGKISEGDYSGNKREKILTDDLDMIS